LTEIWQPNEQFVIRSGSNYDNQNVKKPGVFLFVSLLLDLLISACDGRWQTVSLTTEDFRFMPDMVRVNGSAPLSITIYNAGRESHEFDSPMLMYRVEVSADSSKSSGAGFRLQPGDTLRLVVAPPPGTYLYFCRRKGHANMTGTIIVTQS
jgi:plastocyanin